MPDLKISQLPVATTPLAGTELVPIVQGGTTDQTTVQAILTGTVPSGTANGVMFLNGSKVATTGSDLVFNGSNLGIGTSSPAAKLDVYTAATSIGYVRTANQTLKLTADDAGNRVDIANAAGNPISFTVGVSERMRLDSSGNLGLGVTPATANLTTFQINAASTLTSPTDEVYLSQNAVYNSGWKYLATAYATQYNQNQVSGAHTWNTAPSGTAGNAISFTERMRLDSSGNLGLGVTPSAWGSSNVGVNVGAWAAFAAVGGSAFVGFNAYETAGGGAFKYQNSAPAMGYQLATAGHLWYTAPSGTAGNAITFTQAMTLDASGNLSVGTTSGSTRIYAEGTISARSGTTGIQIYGTGGSGEVNSVGANPLIFLTNSSERARITSGGDLLVGTTDVGLTAGGVRLKNGGGNLGEIALANNSGVSDYVARFLWGSTPTLVGNITVSSIATAYNTSSDARLKENIADAASASDLIDAIQIRQFDWKSNGEHQRYGMVAQELVHVAPEAVTVPTDPDDMLAVDYSKLVPMLIKEVQSLRARVAQLEAQP